MDLPINSIDFAHSIRLAAKIKMRGHKAGNVYYMLPYCEPRLDFEIGEPLAHIANCGCAYCKREVAVFLDNLPFFLDR